MTRIAENNCISLWWSHTMHIKHAVCCCCGLTMRTTDYSGMHENFFCINVKLFTCFHVHWGSRVLDRYPSYLHSGFVIQIVSKTSVARVCTPTAVQLPFTSGPQSENNIVELIHLISTCPNIKKNTVEYRCSTHGFSHIYFSQGKCNVIRLMFERGNRGLFLLSLIH